MRKLARLSCSIALVAACGAATAQTSPNFSFGQVPTPAQWNALFSSKQDVLGYVPLNQGGGVMKGPLGTVASTPSSTGLNIGIGVAPTNPQNGDVWMTPYGMFARFNNITSGPFLSSNQTPSGTAPGSVYAGSAPPHYYATGINNSGQVTYAQPQAGDIAGLAASATIDATNTINVKDTPPYTGSATKSQQAVNALVFDARKFSGVDPTGVLDSTAGINNAISAVSNAGGGVLYICGLFQGQGGHVITSGVTVRACQGGATYLQNTSNSVTFSVQGTDAGIDGILIKPASGITRGPYAAIQVKQSTRPRIKNNVVFGQYIGIELYASYFGQIYGNYVLETAASSGCTTSNIDTCGSKGAWIHGLNAALNSAVDDITSNEVININTKPDYGWYIGGNTNGEVLNKNNSYGAFKPLWITTLTGNSDAAGPVNQMFFNEDAWDTSPQVTPGSCGTADANNFAGAIHADGGSYIQTLSFNGDWFASSSCANGLDINGTNGNVSYIRLQSPQFVNNWSDGLRLTNTTFVEVSSAQAFANDRSSTGGSYVSHGINVLGSASHINIHGGFSAPGPVGGSLINSQAYGVAIQNGATSVIVNGVDVSGNHTGGVLNLSPPGSSNVTINNLGYNPVGVSGVSVGSSPFSYTAGSAPENIYILGGTVSNVSENSTTICTASPCQITLGPNETIQITYSAVPTISKSVH